MQKYIQFLPDYGLLWMMKLNVIFCLNYNPSLDQGD